MKKQTENLNIHLVSGDMPFEFNEAYKALRTNFNFSVSNNGCKSVVVTSAIPNEGKTSVAINLAISLVQIGKRVLLVDTDLRNPSLHRYLNLKKNGGHGLSSILSGNVDADSCVMETLLGFDVIPGGLVPPNPVELISSGNMKALLETMGEKYDFVICDTPPVGLVTDAAALSSQCDGVLFVVRQKMAKKNQVMGAVHKLQSVNAKILGVVMNQFDMKDVPERQYSYYKGYGDYMR